MSGARLRQGVLATLSMLVCLLLVAGGALAQSIMAGGQISEIRVEGTQRIEPETVRSYLRLNPGDPFDPIKIDQSLKSIFATGLFAVCIQHEMDHLEGTLFIDHLSRLKRQRAIDKVKKARRQKAKQEAA